MAQPTLYPPSHEKLSSSPVPKRSRLSLKQAKQRSLLPDSASSPVKYFAPKQQELPSASKCLDEGQECGITNDSVQDENASPNCSFSLPKQTSLPDVVAELIDRVLAPGLPNCGNTCYINSILQVLRYTPNFLNCVHLIISWHADLSQISSSSSEALKETEFLLKLHTLYIAMKKQEILSKNVDKDFTGSLLRPVKAFLLSLREVSSMFEEGEQHDAHEVLLTILSTFSSLCHRIRDSFPQSSEDTNLLNISELSFNELSPNKEAKRTKRLKRCRQKSSSSLQTPKCSLEELRLFEGGMRHCVRCLECEGRLERAEPFTNLEVPIADHLVVEDTVDLLQCLCHRTMLQGENKFFCEECHHQNEAQISSEIVHLPPILLLHCSWLRQSSDITELEKDCTKVLIPVSLTTSEHPEIFQCTENECYTLYAIVLHLGKSTEGGHYVSFVRDTPPSSEHLKNHDVHLSTSGSCCTTEEILEFKRLSVNANRWLLFDDESVTSVHVTESSDTFPYFDFLGITATPCMIFYYK